MTWMQWCLGGCVLGLLAGCVNHPEWALPPEGLAQYITLQQEPRVARSQLSEPPVTLKKPTVMEDLAPPVVAPPTIAPPANSGIVQTSLANRGRVQVAVLAWVNNKPLFEREVIEMARPGLMRLVSLHEPQRSLEMEKLKTAELNKLIDAELMYQEAVKKLEKGNPRALEKLREYVDQEFDKTVTRLRQLKVPEAEMREMEPTARRMLERDLISMEYARSRIVPWVQSRIGFQEIRDYYESHKQDYRSTDRLDWQDIYIPVSEKLPTVPDVQKFAEEMINRCLQPGDFDKLMQFNEGDSKFRNGTGLGNRRKEIQPPELEEHLFLLKEGEIGPVIPFPRGVHVIRVTKREYERQLPLDEKLQKDIRKELEKQLADREYRRIARELRTRAVVRIERETP